MFNLIYDLGGIVLNPKQTFKAIFAERRELLSPLLAVLLFSVAKYTTLTFTLLAKALLLVPVPFMGRVVGVSALLIITLGVVADFACWLLTSIVVYAVSKLLRGRGSFENTLIAIGYSWTPLFVLAFLGVVSTFTDLLIAFGLLVLGLVIWLVWGFIVAIIGVAEAHEIGIGKAFVAVASPALAALLLTLAAGLNSPWWLP